MPPIDDHWHEQAEKAAGLMRQLSNPSRLMILCLLQDGEHTVGEINDEVPLSQSALSQHLAKLREDGLVDTRREGQQIFYRISNPDVYKVIATLYEIFCADSSDH